MTPERATKCATTALPPSYLRYQSGIVPPSECPTMSTFLTPVAARTWSTKPARAWALCVMSLSPPIWLKNPGAVATLP